MNAFIAILALIGGTTILALIGGTTILALLVCLALYLLGYAEIEIEERNDD